MSFKDQKGALAITRERIVNIIWSGIGATVAISLAFWLVSDRYSSLLLVSLGGSTVYLFALTETDESQPRALFGGHIIGAVIGILCFHAFGDGLWVLVAAMVLTMVAMVVTRTIHPPAGANPLVIIHDHAGFSAIFNPFMVGVLVLFLVAILWSRIHPGKRYPVMWWNN